MLGRPILTLKAKALICPCFTTQEDNTAMASINTLSQVSITYHDTTSSSSSTTSTNIAAAASGVGKFVSGLFSNNNSNRGGNANVAGSANSSTSSTSTSSGNHNKGGPTASINIVDTLRGPALAIRHHTIYNDNDDDADGDADSDDDATKKAKSAAAAPKDKTIPLKRIGEIAPNDSFLSSSSTISIYSKKKHSKDQHKELCRIDLHTSARSNIEHQHEHEHDREEIIQALKLLIQWDAQRRASQPPDEEEEDDDEEEEEGRGGLGQRALKMKHFAKREIELKRVKKDREDRKARYLKDSGGLKYTAVAMANRAEIS